MTGVLRRLAGITLIAALLAGCRQSVDLSAVRALAQEVGASGDAFGTLSGDFYGSCVRAYNWRWSAAVSHAAFKPISQACASSAVTSQQWQDSNLVLIEYIQALGNVAGGDDTQTDFGIPGLVSAVTGATNSSLSPDQAKTIGDAGNSLVTDIFNIRRRNEIATYVPQANEHVKKLIDALEQVAQDDYGRQLDFEQDSIGRFYVAVAPPPGAAPQRVHITTVEELQHRLARSAKRRMSNKAMRQALFDRALVDLDRVQILTLRQSYEKERGAVDERRKAITSYIAALETIRSAHDELTASIASNNRSDIFKIVQAYIDEYEPQVKAISAAFAPQEPAK